MQNPHFGMQVLHDQPRPEIALSIENILITQGISSFPLSGTALAEYTGKSTQRREER
jgi:hypothetical protein